MFRLVPRVLRDFVYTRIARNRYALFGQLRECYAPALELKSRFTLPEG